MKQLEAALKREIIDWLNVHGAAVWDNEIPQGVACKASPTGYRRTRNKGSADIVGSLEGGRAIFLEVKLPEYREKATSIYKQLKYNGFIKDYRYNIANKHLIEQTNFLVWQGKTGAIAEFVFSLDDVKAILQRGVK